MMQTRSKNKHRHLARWTLMVLLSATGPWSAASEAATSSKDNVVWTTPSKNSHGSMPIGNGDIGANVWVEPSGDLLLLLSKTDAWDEVSRLCKLGRIRIKLPSLENFRQELCLASGEIVIQGGDTVTRVWIDANQPVVHVEMQGGDPFTTSVRHETWRTKKRTLGRGERRGAWNVHHGLPKVPAIVSADVIQQLGQDRIVFYHRNPTSVWEQHMRMQKMDAFIKPGADPLLNRTFGGLIRGTHLVADGTGVLVAKKPASKYAISITALTAQTETAEEWVEQLVKLDHDAHAVPLEESYKAHLAWWKAFWERSWIKISQHNDSPGTNHSDGGSQADGNVPDTDAALVTRAYALQRWMNAGSGRGGAPIKFNGSIFNVESVERIRSYNGWVDFDADFREWGDTYWFQNTRLMYWTMPMAGDFDLMSPFIKMYTDALPIRKHATKVYFHHDGAFFPECMQFWGTSYGTRSTYFFDPSNIDGKQLFWGKDRRTFKLHNPLPDFSRPPGWQWQAGIELTALLLNYYEYTEDENFRDQKLLPLAEAILLFYEQHWPRKEDGTLEFFPLSSLEAVHNAKNPMPDVAGLHFILPRLIEYSVDETQKNTWKKMYKDLPPLPIGSTEKGPILLAAEQGKRHSRHENPELYAVWPYQIFGIGKKENIQAALNFWPKRSDKVNKGWNQDIVHAAMLGLTDEATRLVTARFTPMKNGFRFPVIWGPNYDWIPDQNHGTTAMRGLQSMLMQIAGDKIYLLPAWPKKWDVDFKLHAPRQTTVECSVRNGKVVKLKVVPESRGKDVIVMDPR